MAEPLFVRQPGKGRIARVAGGGLHALAGGLINLHARLEERQGQRAAQGPRLQRPRVGLGLQAVMHVK
ncbi:hypothetical protein D3C72_2334460 [compost metagenome]